MVKLILIIKFFLFSSLIKKLYSSECTNANNIYSEYERGLNKDDCMSVNYYYNNNYNNTNSNSSYCCFLTIKEKSIEKCIEIEDINDEDEINKKIEAFQIMFKNTEVSIDCSKTFINIKILLIILIIISEFL